jgi:hypothetical protein
MKKYIVPTIVLILIAAGILIRYEIVAPARAAARDLEAINGITVGKMTEAELLGRTAFQKVDRRCIEADCIYHTERTNDFLWRLHRAPSTFFGTAVWVRDGMVVQVAVFISREGLTPISLAQKTSLPAECTANPCVKQLVPPNKRPASIKVMFNNESEFRNRMPEAMQTVCLSRLRGCSSYEELMPLARGLNLDAIAAFK